MDTRLWDYVNVASVVLSVLAMGSSAALWLLERRKERPRLLAFWSRRPSFWPGRQLTDDPNVLSGAVELAMIFANLSTLPDTVVAIRSWIKSRDGRWLPAQVFWTSRTHGQAYPELPVNLPPRSTATVPFGVAFDVPVQVHDSDDMGGYLADPLAIKVELTGLGDRTHTSEVTLGGWGRPPE